MFSSARPRPLPRRRRAGFTLIELLTVIAIIGILAAIIIPTVGAVRASARSSKSASNLRQLALAVRLYAEDHKGALAPGQSNWSENWIATLWTYAGGTGHPYSQGHQTERVFFGPGWESRPGYDSTDTWRQGYAMNGQPGLPEAWQLNWSTGNPADTYVGRYRLDAVTNPTRRLLFVESAQWHLDAANLRETSPLRSIDFDRNGSGVNIAFFDGHVAKSADLDAIEDMVANP